MHKENNPPNPTHLNYFKFAQAQVLKNGPIRDKAKSLDILEDLVNIYPNNISILVTLIESLFEDINISYDESTVVKIDNFMKRIEKIPLRKNPQVIISFVSQQILLSKYNFYIKGNVNNALDILYKAKKTVKNYEIPHLEQLIENEIFRFKERYQKWDNINKSINERFRESEFQEYLREALIMLKKDDKD